MAEVVSPSDRPREVQAKVHRWLEFGEPAVVVIEPVTRTVVVHKSSDESVIYRGNETIDLDFVVPGFRLEIKKLFS